MMDVVSNAVNKISNESKHSKQKCKLYKRLNKHKAVIEKCKTITYKLFFFCNHDSGNWMDISCIEEDNFSFLSPLPNPFVEYRFVHNK